MNTYKRTKKITALVSALSILSCASAMAAAVTPPDSGNLLQQQQGNTLPAQVKPAPGIEVGGQQQKTASAPAGTKFLVKSFHVTGQTIFREDKLVSLLKDSAGKELTLGELQGIAGRIAKYFNTQGYLVANAYIPAQDINGGVVEIAVMVGQYGKIDIRNHSHLKAEVAANLLSNIKSGDYIQKEKLERALLLFNDTPGVGAKATLAPGKAAGTSDLIVEVSDTSKTNGQITLANWGERYTGKNQLGVNTNINDLTGRGDMVTLGGTYAGTGMNDYSVNYTLPTGGQGAKFGVGYSRMHYALGEDFASLDASGLAETTSLFESYALTRSRDFNLNGRVEYDRKELIDSIDSVSSYSQKNDNIVVVGLSGDSRDQLGGGGANNFALTYSRGNLGLESADALSNDSDAQTAGSYGKTNLTVNRIQAINNRANLYLSFMGQMSNKNLDSSEKLQIGGPNGVRAYPEGEAPSDEGYIFTGEYRWNLPKPNFQLVAFYDNGKAIVNQNPWVGAGVNNRILSGAGLGLRWTPAKDYSIRLDYAWEITTNDPATSDTNSNGRLWLQCVKYF